jgi:hypothetical protein
MKNIYWTLLLLLSFNCYADVITTACIVSFDNDEHVSEYPDRCYHGYRGSAGNRDFSKFKLDFKWMLENLKPNECPKGFTLFDQKPSYSGFGSASSYHSRMTGVSHRKESLVVLTVTNTCISK